MLNVGDKVFTDFTSGMISKHMVVEVRKNMRGHKTQSGYEVRVTPPLPKQSAVAFYDAGWFWHCKPLASGNGEGAKS